MNTLARATIVVLGVVANSACEAEAGGGYAADSDCPNCVHGSGGGSGVIGGLAGGGGPGAVVYSSDALEMVIKINPGVMICGPVELHSKSGKLVMKVLDGACMAMPNFRKEDLK